MAENIDINVNVAGNAGRALNSLNADLNKVSASFANMRNAIGGLALGSLVNNLLNTSAALVDLAKATGLTVEAVKGLSDAISDNGGNSEKAGQILVKFTDTLDQARRGIREAQQAFEGVGIPVKDLSKSNSELAIRFAENVGKMAEFEGEARAAGAAAEVTGKGIRTIDLKGFGSDARGAVDAAKQYTGAIQNADKVQEQLEKTIRKAKDELLLFLKPVLDFLATEEGWKAFTTTIKTLAVIFGVMFGAKMIKSIYDFNKQLETTELLGRKLGKNPLLKLALLAGGAFAIDKLAEKMGILNDETDILGKSAKDVDFDKLAQEANNQEGQQSDVSTRETDQKKKSLKDMGKAYEDQIDAIRRNTQEQINALKVGEDQAAIDKVKADIEKNAADAVERYNQEKAKLDTKKDADLIAVIEAQIAAINKRKDADITAAQEEVSALQQLQNANEQFYAQLETSFMEYQNAVANDEALQQLRDQTELVGKYGKELEILQAKQKIDQELRAKNNKLTEEQVKLSYDMAKAIQANNLAEVDNIKIKLEGIQRIKDANERAAADQKAQTEQNIKDSDMATKTIYEQITNAVARTREQLKQYNFGDSLVQNLSQAIDTFIETGKFKFKDFAGALLKEWIAMKAKMHIFDVLDGLSQGLKNIFSGGSFFGGGGAGGNIFGSLFKGIGKIFGFAEGGSPPVNRPSIVGEAGPELFVPKTAGTVLPNDMLGGMRDRQVTNNYITNNINALDSKSVAQVFAENRKTLLGTVRMAQRELPFG
jgi:hypothetical protein